jgi:phosphate ABC transporter phosphate-binding protein
MTHGSPVRPVTVRHVAASVGIVLVLLGAIQASTTPPAQAAAAHAPISGAGSTWSANALDQWIRNVFSNYQWKISFGANGSSAGRQEFRNGTKDFAVSEIPYDLAGSDAADPRPTRPLAYLPIVAGGTAFMYNLQIGGRRVTNLRLSGEVVAKIFTNQITVWNDPAIKADNPGLNLPAIPIVPVVRSDGSGTTAQFTTWMRQQHPGVWNAFCQAAGRGSSCGITSNYPIVAGSRAVGQSGSNSVAGYVANAQRVGSITYVEYSYALNARYPVAKVLNAGGYYTEPTASNVAVALLGSRINEDPSSRDYLTQNLTGVYNSTDPRTYPLSSYSYMIVPTTSDYGFTAGKGRTLADFTSYFLCEGQQQAETLGYSPLPINLVQAGQAQMLKIPGGDPQVKGINQCNNPTFSPDGSNRLATTAPMPADCDKQGPTQCAKGTGGAADTTTPVTGGASGDGGDAAAGGSGDAAAGPGEAGSGDSSVVGADGQVREVQAEPQSIRAGGLGIPLTVLMITIGLALLAFALIPPLAGSARRARRSGVPPPWS